ncbi:hypothetical protein BJY16_006802 [Actinoplanes octamycinicus]|uniref:S-adenosyl methyltransferase n=1 Tax=Actinoplanes octamycinicus TaxID=135948 RepID=A0A7W7MAS2_9ACTN|nr:SAM-dependent methyltransferase [Actinoplanes octamycinicus]MBB4743343.1 hypothetical protein [Actinoplanes octamycinicus]GIE61859.1 hypothetical protein Aoc01nite_72610 [Actinoplanes octamycinicus]
MTRPSWAPPEIDIDRPSIARVYDYWIGGSHNFPVDREVGRTVEQANPMLPQTFRANRAFLRRAVRELSGLGIRQFLDVGSGIPTEGNVHEIALACAPDSRVVYVDIDPVAVAHAGAILADEPRAVAIQGDIFKWTDILDAPQTRALLDFDQPIAVILAAIIHFVPPDADPVALVDRYVDPLAPGSYLVVTHAGAETVPDATPGFAARYQGAVNEVIWRDRAEVTSLFHGLELLEPGVVPVPLWRPEPGGDPDGLGADAPMLAGVARKS